MNSPIEVFLVFDLETTGLSPEKNAILEIACCPFDINLKDLPEFDSGIMNVYDDRDISDGALNANGISRKQIAEGRDPKEVIEEFTKYLKSLAKTANKIVLVGHNIDSFDIPFLDNCFTYFKKDLSKFVNEKITADTLWWSRIMLPESMNYKLGTMCSNLEVELVGAHRALADTRANKELFKKMISNLRGTGETVAKSTEPKFRETFSL